MDLKNLRYFTAIVDQGNLSKASKAVHISQPALTVAMQNLEAELGIPLFERAGRRMHPTKEGYELYQHARVLLSQAEQVKAYMMSLKSLNHGEITLAAPVTLGTSRLVNPIADFMVKHPNVRINFIQMGGPDIERALLNREIDFGFLSRPPDTDKISRTPICYIPLHVFVRKSHPLAKEPYITWRQTFDHPLVTFPKSYMLYRSLINRAQEYRRPANIILSTDIIPLLVEVVRRRDVVCIMPASIGSQVPDLISIPLINDDKEKGIVQPVMTKFNVCHLKGAPLSLAAKAFLSHLQDVLNENAANPED